MKKDISTYDPKEFIIIKAAKLHNLKNIDLAIPKNKLVVITGLSGSGKSSLAFDTLYAEGQRRYVESLSSYARQLLGKLDLRPRGDYPRGRRIYGIPPDSGDLQRGDLRLRGTRPRREGGPQITRGPLRGSGRG